MASLTDDNEAGGNLDKRNIWLIGVGHTSFISPESTVSLIIRDTVALFFASTPNLSLSMVFATEISFYIIITSHQITGTNLILFRPFIQIRIPI